MVPAALPRFRYPLSVPRLPREHAAFTGLSAGVVLLLFALTRKAWFFHDEWVFIRDRSFSDPTTWLLPHAQHFVAVHVAIYTALVAIFGTTTYLPYQLVAWTAHVAFVAGVYALVAREVGRRPALAASAVCLLLGSAYLNLFWAFQMGPLGSLAFAMWALVLIRERPALSAILLVVGVATAGFALFLVPACALYGWSRRALLVSCLPVLVYGFWFLVERPGAVSGAVPPTIETWLAWAPLGLADSAKALLGLGSLSVIPILAILPLLPRSPARRLALVGFVSLLTEYLALGIVRQGANTPAGWQYIYPGAAFLVLVFAAAWPVTPRAVRPAAITLFVVALALNVLALLNGALVWPTFMASYDPYCLLCY